MYIRKNLRKEYENEDWLIKLIEQKQEQLWKADVVRYKDDYTVEERIVINAIEQVNVRGLLYI